MVKGRKYRNGKAENPDMESGRIHTVELTERERFLLVLCVGNRCANNTENEREELLSILLKLTPMERMSRPLLRDMAEGMDQPYPHSSMCDEDCECRHG